MLSCHVKCHHVNRTNIELFAEPESETEGQIYTFTFAILYSLWFAGKYLVTLFPFLVGWIVTILSVMLCDITDFPYNWKLSFFICCGTYNICYTFKCQNTSEMLQRVNKMNVMWWCLPECSKNNLVCQKQLFCLQITLVLTCTWH